MANFLGRLFGDPNQREWRRLQPLVEQTNRLEPAFQALSDQALVAKTTEFRRRLAGGTALDALQPEAFAAVREATSRALSKRHYDVQLLAGAVLHQGKIAEMKTGEGKTQVALLPLYLNALAGQGCHLVTPNDYLARFGGGWMAPVYQRLGMSVAVICPMFAGLYDPEFIDPIAHGDDRLMHWRPVARREAYRADVTYGTNSEFGFDYLRDNLAVSLDQRVQRPLHFAIVDEVDNILIDEARTPLIISAPAEEAADLYYRFAQIMRQVQLDADYLIDERSQGVTFTDEGVEKVERLLGIDNLYAEVNFWLARTADAALKAQVLKRRDRDYVVRNSEVVIVDEFTGRMLQGRRWSEGLHQAVEAKEGVPVQRENRTMATITYQNYFRMYDKLAGMTGTAATEAEEFAKIYALDVVTVPTHRPMIREDHTDYVFKTEAAKYNAVGREVAALHAEGRPVLVGTVSIEKSELLSRLLHEQGIPHNVLNAKFHEQEAAIVAEAGQPNTVTIATNMAGRGTDIVLGEGVQARGGLHIIGTERHESRRIDNQLRGRAGRQGDPGSSRFYVSLEDDLMRRFGSERIAGIMNWLKMPEDEPIEHGTVTKAIESAQTKVEGYNFDIRKHVVEYDNVMNEQRAFIYADRNKVLRGENMRDYILTLVDRHVTSLVDRYMRGAYSEEWDLDGLVQELGQVLPVPEDLTAVHLGRLSRDEALALLLERVHTEYDHREDQLGDVLTQARAELGGYLLSLTQRRIGAVIEQRLVGPVITEDDLQGLLEDLAQSLPLPADITVDTLVGLDQAGLATHLMERCVAEFERDPAPFHTVLMREFERQVVLGSVDTLWVEHLTGMDDLREGIGLRAFGQRDPLVEYKREAHEQWERFVTAINAQIVQNIFRLGLRIELVPPSPQTQTELHTNRDDVDLPATPPRRTAPGGGPATANGSNGKVGRNDLCPCGSGRKYKFCHGASVTGTPQNRVIGAPAVTNGALGVPLQAPSANGTATGAKGDGRSSSSARRAKQIRRRG
ncbi:MAG: preprotein translocase subunit SecA [Chloroflexota bacterium]